MRQLIRDMRNDLKEKPGVNVHLEVPREINNRIKQLVISDEDRSGQKILSKDKYLEALVTGIEALEVQDREKE